MKAELKCPFLSLYYAFDPVVLPVREFYIKTQPGSRTIIEVWLYANVDRIRRAQQPMDRPEITHLYGVNAGLYTQNAVYGAMFLTCLE